MDQKPQQQQNALQDGRDSRPVLGESEAIVMRIFGRAVAKAGGTAALARHLGIHYSELRSYLSGDAMPPEIILLRAVDVIMDELPEIRRDYTPGLWHSLRLPAA